MKMEMPTTERVSPKRAPGTTAIPILREKNRAVRKRLRMSPNPGSLQFNLRFKNRRLRTDIQVYPSKAPDVPMGKTLVKSCKNCENSGRGSENHRSAPNPDRKAVGRLSSL